MKEQNKYGGIDLATSITGLAKSTIYNLVGRREIPFIKKRRKLYFNEDDLINWIESGDDNNPNEKDVVIVQSLQEMLLDPMWSHRYSEMKKGLKKIGGPGNNQDIAEIIGNTASSVRNITQPNKEFPRWAKLSVVLYERYIKDNIQESPQK